MYKNILDYLIKNQMSDCIGVTHLRELCKKLLDEDEGQFCEKHKYQETIPKKVLKGILDGTNTEWKTGAPECKHWHNEKTVLCQPCCVKKRATAKARAEKIVKCAAFLSVDKTVGCSRKPKPGTLYCKPHSYLIGVTRDELISNYTVCSNPSCHKHFLTDPKNPTKKRCIGCDDDGAKQREKTKVGKIYCKFKDCENGQLKEGYLGSFGYCGHHKEIGWKISVEESGKKVCRNYNHGSCRSILELTDPSMCSPCLEKQRTKDKNDRSKEKESIENFNNQQDQEVKKEIIKVIKKNAEVENYNKKVDEHNEKLVKIIGDSKKQFEHKEVVVEHVQKQNKMCLCCGEIKDFQTNFIQEKTGKETVNCKPCREENADLDKKYRKASKKYYKKNPEKVERMKKLRLEYPEYAKLLDSLHKLNVMEKLGLDQFRKQEAEKSQKYRDEHPNIMAEVNAKKRTSVKDTIYYYKYRAENNKPKIIWAISDERANELICGQCFYCGEADIIEGESYINSSGEITKKIVNMCGIDRLDNNDGYTYANAKSCCKICNFMKKCTDSNTYLSQARHIVSRFLLTNVFYKSPESFTNHYGVTFDRYFNRAKKKEFDFSLKPEEFDSIRIQDCYMCCKPFSFNHINGIDRFYNSKGYTVDNSFACCSDCNYIKNEFDFYEVLRKLYLTVCNKFSDVYKFNKNISDNIRSFCAYQIKLLNNDKITTMKQIIEDNKINVTDKAEPVEKEFRFDMNSDGEMIEYDDNVELKPTKINKSRIEKVVEFEKKRNKRSSIKEKIRTATVNNKVDELDNAKKELHLLENDPNYKPQKNHVNLEKKGKFDTKPKKDLKDKKPPLTPAERKRLSRQRKREEMGDDAYKAKVALEKRRERENK